MIKLLEDQELIQKLVDNGYKDFVDTVLFNESKAFTKKGKANRSGICRIMGWKPKQLEEVLEECRKLLEES